VTDFKATYDERYLGNYREELSGFEVARWAALEHFIPVVVAIRGGEKVLDYGSGRGLHVPLWQKLFPRGELHFCDISTVAIEKLLDTYPQYASSSCAIRDDATDFASNEFDVVVSVEVMEHVESLRSYLTDIHRVLKPGGKFIWTTPCGNILSVEHIYSLLTGQIEPTAYGSRKWSWEDPTHVRRLKTGEIRFVLESLGFQDTRFRYRAHFFSFFATFFPGKRLKHLRANMRPWRLWSKVIPERLSPEFSEALMKLDYSLFRTLPNGASMIGCAVKK